MIYSLGNQEWTLDRIANAASQSAAGSMRKVVVENVRMRLVELPACGGGSTGGSTSGGASAKLISPNDPFVIVYVMCPARTTDEFRDVQRPRVERWLAGVVSKQPLTQHALFIVPRKSGDARLH